MKLIDTDALANDLEDLRSFALDSKGQSYYDGEANALSVVIGKLKNTPTVDAVPVVRCKDCKWFRDSNGIDGFCYCDRIYRRCGTHWFCADGERRESE